MLKPTLIGLSVAILLDFATFSGAYTHKVFGESVRLVYAVITQDWHLTHH